MRISTGDTVYDLVTKRTATIIECKVDPDSGGQVVVRLDDSIPKDPTGDGSFPDGWRNDFEVCDPRDAARDAKLISWLVG